MPEHRFRPAVRAVAAAGCTAFLVVGGLWLVPARASIVAVQDTGRLTIDHAGARSTLFELRTIVPGEEVAGTVTLGNDGVAPGGLRLQARRLEDTTGAIGLPFSEVLVVTISEPGAQGPPLWRGTLATLGTVDLGRLGPRAQRAFRVAVRWPDTGLPASPTTGDNAYQGAISRFVLAWGLEEDIPQAPVAGGDSSLSGVAARSAVVVKPIASRTCVSRRRFKIRVARTRTLRPTSATISIGGKRVKVLRGPRLRAVIDLRGRPRQTVVVRITGRTASGRPYRETRRYRTCVAKRKKAKGAAASIVRTVGR